MPNVFSPRDLVFRPDNMDETVPHMRAGYTLDIMRQTACLVFNSIMVEDYAALLRCTTVVQASDSMTASM